jgi:hypothetical protein
MTGYFPLMAGNQSDNPSNMQIADLLKVPICINLLYE